MHIIYIYGMLKKPVPEPTSEKVNNAISIFSLLLDKNMDKDNKNLTRKSFLRSSFVYSIQPLLDVRLTV